MHIQSNTARPSAVADIKRTTISDVIDLFGSDVRFSGEDESGVTVTTVTNELAVEQFAKSFCPDVVILEPERLREEMRDYLKNALKCYTE